MKNDYATLAIAAALLLAVIGLFVAAVLIFGFVDLLMFFGFIGGVWFLFNPDETPPFNCTGRGGY
jgi:hypothetical protein